MAMKVTDLDKYIIGTASMVTLTLGAANGVGIHKAELTAEQKKLSILYAFMNQILVLTAIIPAKIAVVIFLLRVQGYGDFKRYSFLWFWVVTNAMFNLMAIPFILTQCKPVSDLWEGSGLGNCNGRLRTEIVGYIQGCTFPYFYHAPTTCNLSKAS